MASTNTNKIIEDFVENIKDSLNLGDKTLIGMDIGQSSLKIAEVKSNKDGSQFELVKYINHPLPEGTLIEDEIQNEEELVSSIKEALVEGNFATKSVTIGIFGPSTIARKLQLAGGTPEEIEDQVVWESEQYIPFEIEDSNISFHIVGENEGGGVDVVVAAATKGIISNFKKSVESAGLKVKIVDLCQLAIVNVFEHVYSDVLEDSNSSYLILSIGAQKTDFIIYKNNMINFSKEINIGGLMITEEVQRQMGVTYLEAEDLKITGDENGNLPEEILEIVDDVVESFFSEIKKTIDFYVSSTSDEMFESCYVTGGSAQIPGILDGLEALLGFPVSVLNPFEAISFDDSDYSEAEFKDISFRSVCAIGLGMRQLK